MVRIEPPQPTQPKPTIAVSLGDPGGIGAECLVKALADRDRRKRARYRVFGSAEPLRLAADRAGLGHDWWSVPAGSTLEPSEAHDVVLIDSGGEGFEARPTKHGGALSFGWVESAIEACRACRAQAMVTGPISKEAWALAGKKRFPGHTELLAERFGAKRVAMLFESDELRVILATAHVPLMDIRNVLTIGKVFDAIDLGHAACRQLGIAEPRIAVCGLNPHAGEAGLLGDEEARIIRPAIEHAVRSGIRAEGPLPGDTVFNQARRRAGGRRGGFDLVVAMYHDQGLIPVKLLAWDRAVNVTCGLPTPRTSPDHGTAFDLVGRDAADPGSMGAALDLAVRLSALPAPAQGS
ncbi:MAG: 4-hydroxythreonine-4-phosphate dehydrogenase PdxA [Planctomycetota bacterium]